MADESDFPGTIDWSDENLELGGATSSSSLTWTATTIDTLDGEFAWASTFVYSASGVLTEITDSEELASDESVEETPEPGGLF